MVGDMPAYPLTDESTLPLTTKEDDVFRASTDSGHKYATFECVPGPFAE